jgi:hypothetical protein
MYKNIAATLQIVERARREQQRGGREATVQPVEPRAPRVDAAGTSLPKLGPMQKIVAFGPLA